MKKLLALMLCLAMAMLPALGLAETAADTTTYENYETATDPDGVYTFAYPEGYTLLDKTTLDAVLDAAQENTELGTTIEQYRPLIEGSNIVMLLSADYSLNINIVAQDMAVELTPDQLLASAETFVAQLKASIPELEIIEEASLIDSGDDFKPMVLGYQYSANGATLNGYQGYFTKGAKFFVVTLTGLQSKINSQSLSDLGFIMASITLQ